MIAKEVKFESDAKEKIVSGVTILARSVKSTLGPHGRTVLLESEHHIGGMTATKDGVTVANSIAVLDPLEDIAIRIVREAARKTAFLAGDGTTTAIVLAEAILKETLKRTFPSDNMTEITRNISLLIERVVSSLDQKSKDVTGDMLYHVATISSNNDVELGKMIGMAYENIGKEGVVHVKDHKGYDTTCEISDGITFDRGYSSVLQITNHKGKSCEMINPYILVTDRKIESLHNIGALFQSIIESNRPILIIGELGKDAQDTFGYNIVNNVIRGASVIPPGRGHLQEELLMDIAAATGAKFISDKTGTEWGLVTLADLGTADKVIVDRESTNIVKDTNPEAMEERLDSLRSQLANAKDDHETKILQGRIANLCGKVATINVGGSTPMEQKERKDRVDDAVLATKAALEEGVLAGGGIALLEESNMIDSYDDMNMVLAVNILSAALEAPFKQILLNGHIDPEEILRGFNVGDGMGYNSKTGEYGDMFELGVIDPAKVTKTALKNGGAVAVTLLMSDTVITNKREHQMKDVTKDTDEISSEWSLLWGLFKFKSKG